MSTYSPGKSHSPVLPRVGPRLIPFDPLAHARFFVSDNLQLSTNAQGNPKLFVTTQIPGGCVDAGSIVWIPPTQATLAGPAYPASIAITGRMAEYTPAQREVLQKVGVTFKGKAGDRKTFFTAYIPETQIKQAIDSFASLRTATGNDCLLGKFTARAIDLFRQRMDAVRDPES